MQASNNIVKFNRPLVAANNIVCLTGFGILENQLGFCELPLAHEEVDPDYNPLTSTDCVVEDPDTLSMTIYCDPEFAQVIVDYINEQYEDAIAFNESSCNCGSIRVECITPDAFWNICPA